MMMFNSTQKKLYEAWAQTVFKASTLITDTVGLGFRPVWQDMFNYIQKYIGFNNIPKDAWILVLNDFDLTATKALREMGYYNIIMLVTDTTKEQTPTTYFFDVKFEDRKFKKLFPNGWSKVWKDVWFLNAVEVQNVGDKGKLLKTTHTEYRIQGDLINMNFDLIIANPPYGKIGANITKTIIDTVTFKEYINLLPMVDYEKADAKYPLWHHVDLATVQSFAGSFADAGISPLLVKIKKSDTTNSLTVEDFRISCLENKLTQKYFTANIARENTFVIAEQFSSLDLSKSIALPLRTKSGNHSGQANLGKTEKSQFYLINNGMKQSVTEAETKSICCTTITFKTALEKQNVAKLFYSNLGYKFTSWLMTGMNRDAFHLREHHMWFPRIDWTRAWTVKEILANYGYTEAEIAEVIADLENFKGMERD